MPNSTPIWATPTLRSMPRLEELAIFIKTALCQDWHPTATVIDGFNDDRISLASPETLAIRVNFSDGLFRRATESDSNLGPITALPTHRTKVLSSYELKHCIGGLYTESNRVSVSPCFPLNCQGYQSLSFSICMTLTGFANKFQKRIRPADKADWRAVK